MPMAGMALVAHGWLGGYPGFVMRWVGMMGAMMVPAVLPKLWKYGLAVAGAGPARTGALVLLAGVGYLGVWAVFGAVVYPARVALGTALVMLPAVAHAAPILVGLVVTAAGALQLSRWKARHLACWQAPPRADRPHARGAVGAWSYGTRLGMHCTCCGASFTAGLLAVGAMDLRVMAAAAVAIAMERLTPSGLRIARALGGVGVAAGIVMVARAAGIG